MCYELSYKEELMEALRVVSSSIINCEKYNQNLQRTSQHSLLRNRIKALHISKALIESEDIIDKYTKEELIEALPL